MKLVVDLEQSVNGEETTVKSGTWSMIAGKDVLASIHDW